jgi:hypothetical protein
MPDRRYRGRLPPCRVDGSGGLCVWTQARDLVADAHAMVDLAPPCLVGVTEWNLLLTETEEILKK